LFTTGVLFVEADRGRRPSTTSRAGGVAAFACCLALVAARWLDAHHEMTRRPVTG
jgi:hypothetical protein